VLVEDVERGEVLFVESSVSSEEPFGYPLGVRADQEIGEHSISFSVGFEMLLRACGISRFEVYRTIRMPRVFMSAIYILMYVPYFSSCKKD